ncbi:hypothetical protein COK07_27425 [Bacillus thuringiensis]|uniref:hypothetical protein n=1 Tax=Bacillus thuringiensis TaxID=1428 RepID=UPI000BF331C1|nr:hypothetical protein [Bacillus thuringiensis]PFP71471.1 hypothetical protein COK07_27425 [Bacillus thuringiensis]
MNYYFRNCDHNFIPAAILKPPTPPNKPTIQSMTNQIRNWIYLWSYSGYTGWVFVLQVGVEKNSATNKLESAIWVCNPSIGNKFCIFLKTIDNYATLI